MTPETKKRIEIGLAEYIKHIQAAHDTLGALIDNVLEMNTPNTMTTWLVLGGLLRDIDKINTMFWNIKEAEK
jgi:hypothetical protein